ncbi:MAG: immunity protein Imm33 domain-containing protein [Pseudomonadota bacterium]
MFGSTRRRSCPIFYSAASPLRFGSTVKIEQDQRALCKKYGADFLESPGHMKIGISRTVLENLQPLNGLRHSPEGDTTGWYIWAGEEFSDDPDFFKPLHVEHVDQWSPLIRKYLGLGPGWRFVATDDYEDVWFDESLLNT